MTPSLHFALELVSAGSLALGAQIERPRLLSWWRKDPAKLERRRRLEVNGCGRITAGRIGDLLEVKRAESKSWLVNYSYEVAGVTYEAAQDVTALPEIAAIALFLFGSTASVKYDPERPANSIIACEEWSGLGDVDWVVRSRARSGELDKGLRPFIAADEPKTNPNSG